MQHVFHKFLPADALMSFRKTNKSNTIRCMSIKEKMSLWKSIRSLILTTQIRRLTKTCLTSNSFCDYFRFTYTFKCVKQNHFNGEFPISSE